MNTYVFRTTTTFLMYRGIALDSVHSIIVYIYCSFVGSVSSGVGSKAFRYDSRFADFVHLHVVLARRVIGLGAL